VTDQPHDVYVYGIVPSGELEDAPSDEVRLVVHGDLAAIVSDVQEGTRTAARHVRAHWRVLEDAAGKATVVPVRFGTVMAGDGAVVNELLAPDHDRLAGQLAQLAGKVQLTVKALYDEDSLLRGVVSGSREVERLRERVRSLPEAAGYYDRIRLGELVAAEVEQARERDAAWVIGRLEPLAVAARREEVASSDGAMTAAFLVERERVPEVEKVMTALAEEGAGRMRLQLIGPLPPYSFADEEVGAWA
jgi:hypothetical protein